jgi:hypothetical protein
VVELVRLRKRGKVVVVSDDDEPGRRGADNLACVLSVYSTDVRVIAPPAGIKDARDWLRAGCSRADLENAIKSARVRRFIVRACVGR